MKLAAEQRAAGKAQSLRRMGRLPGIVYNKELNQAIHVDTRTFDRVFRSQGTSRLIDLEVDGDTHTVLVKAVQMNKRQRVPVHVDFYVITAGQPVDVFVPISYTGASEGVLEGGQLDVQRRELHISILPRLIPTAFEVDISALRIGDSIHIGDVSASLPEEAVVLDDADLTLITVVAPRVIEEPEVVEVEGELEPELIGRTDEEGDDETVDGETDES